MFVAEFFSRLHLRYFTRRARLRIAFVAPWYGEKVGGGAEALCRSLVHALRELYPDVETEVITTCLKEFSNDWNDNVHPEGLRDESGIAVRRFRATQPDRSQFHQINYFRLMPHLTADLWQDGKRLSPLTKAEEAHYIDNMIQSPDMYRYLARHRYRYDFFLLLPYMFGTTCAAGRIVAGRAVMIPCLHDERYAYMNLYEKSLRGARGLLFNVPSEQRLFRRLYGVHQIPELVSGVIVDTDVQQGNAQRFRDKFSVKGPYILYAGRKVAGKNVPLLVDFFTRYKRSANAPRDLQLVLMGSGDLSYPRERYPDVIETGFVTVEDKSDAYAGAELLIQPSINESFSIVIMESWLQGRPVAVHADCEVTKDHCEISGGGFAFRTVDEFSAVVQQVLGDPVRAAAMGASGRKYVLDNYSKQIVTSRIVDFLRTLKKS